jgi:hypothetical protein
MQSQSYQKKQRKVSIPLVVFAAHLCGESKVSDLDVAIARDENVVAFDVAMDARERVNVLQTFHCLTQTVRDAYISQKRE